MQEKLVTTLRLRLGYKEEVTLTRDELNLLVDGDIGVQKELEEEVACLSEEIAELKDECEELEEAESKIKELESKLERIQEIMEE